MFPLSCRIARVVLFADGTLFAHQSLLRMKVLYVHRLRNLHAEVLALTVHALDVKEVPWVHEEYFLVAQIVDLHLIGFVVRFEGVDRIVELLLEIEILHEVEVIVERRVQRELVAHHGDLELLWRLDVSDPKVEVVSTALELLVAIHAIDDLHEDLNGAVADLAKQAGVAQLSNWSLIDELSHVALLDVGLVLLDILETSRVFEIVELMFGWLNEGLILVAWL